MSYKKQLICISTDRTDRGRRASGSARLAAEELIQPPTKRLARWLRA